MSCNWADIVCLSESVDVLTATGVICTNRLPAGASSDDKMLTLSRAWTPWLCLPCDKARKKEAAAAGVK